MLINSKRVALDSSHWSALLSDANSDDPSSRAFARSFAKQLLERGYIILFCFEHLLELLAHKNERVITQRLLTLREIELLMWIRTNTKWNDLGGVIDIAAAECKAAYLKGGDAVRVRVETSSKILAAGSGRDVIPDDPYILNLLVNASREMAEKQRVRAAILPVKFQGWKIPIRSYFTEKVLTRVEWERNLQELEKILALEIEKRGDRRIVSPNEHSKHFFVNVKAVATSLPTESGRSFVLKSLEPFGINEEDIGPKTTLADITHLTVFRKQLPILARKCGVPEPLLRANVRLEQLPHRLISNALENYRQDIQIREGGEINDRYLAALACYADVTYVDKRTHENFRRAFQKEPGLELLVGERRKAASYRDIVKTL